ncbi:LOW QUALITY PROTEIN: hypothetical protein V2J09_010848 [Rumex salicifolius]
MGLVETRISCTRANDICNQIGYDGVMRVDPHGFVGGIWLGRQKSLLRTFCFMISISPWVFSAIYAFPTPSTREWFDELNLIDLGFSGNILGRWRLRFPVAVVRHLSVLHSDHSLILVKLSSSQPTLQTTTWRNDINLQGTLSHLATHLCDWNRRVFDNIFAKKCNLWRQLEQAQNRLSSGPSCVIIQLERTICEKLEEEIECILPYRGRPEHKILPHLNNNQTALEQNYYPRE